MICLLLGLYCLIPGFEICSVLFRRSCPIPLTLYGTQGTVAPAGSGISIKFKQFGITVETAGDKSEVARGESLEITCSEKKGSEEIGLCDWYIGTTKVASGKSFTFSATNPLYADSVQLSITVR